MTAWHRSPVLTSEFYAWRSGVESLSLAKSSCPSLYGEQWQSPHAAMLDFLERLGGQAVEFGWTDLDLFGIHSRIGTGRVDHCGTPTLGAMPAEWIDAKRMNFGNMTYYRDKPGQPRSGVIWALKERPSTA